MILLISIAMIPVQLSFLVLSNFHPMKTPILPWKFLGSTTLNIPWTPNKLQQTRWKPSKILLICHIAIAGWWFGTCLFNFFPIYWVSNHPTWRTHIFQKGGSTTNQHLQVHSPLQLSHAPAGSSCNSCEIQGDNCPGIFGTCKNPGKSPKEVLGKSTLKPWNILENHLGTMEGHVKS